MVLLSYRYSYARIQYTVLEKALDSGNKLPSGVPQNDMLESLQITMTLQKPRRAGGGGGEEFNCFKIVAKWGGSHLS